MAMEEPSRDGSSRYDLYIFKGKAQYHKLCYQPFSPMESHFSTLEPKSNIQMKKMQQSEVI